MRAGATAPRRHTRPDDDAQMAEACAELAQHHGRDGVDEPAEA
jgi:hypothetical protein